MLTVMIATISSSADLNTFQTLPTFLTVPTANNAGSGYKELRSEIGDTVIGYCKEHHKLSGKGIPC